MDINIKSIAAAYDSCTQIDSYRKKLLIKINDLEIMVRKLDVNWESGGSDKTTYLSELKNQINNYRILENSIGTFITEIRNYCRRIEEASRHTI